MLPRFGGGDRWELVKREKPQCSSAMLPRHPKSVSNYRQFATGLLNSEDVAILPCDTFGPSADGHLRISLTEPDPRLAEAGRRIVRYACSRRR